MTRDEFISAQETLGLSNIQFAQLLGCTTMHVSRLRTREGQGNHRPVSPCQSLLIAAYLSGYRPPNWPVAHETK